MTNHTNGLLNSLDSHSADGLKALLSVLDALPEIAFILSFDGDYIEIFGSQDSLMIQESQFLLGKTVYQVMPKEKADFIVNNIRLCLNENRNVSVEYELKVPKGLCLFEAGIAPLYGLNYAKPVVIWFARDITSQRKEQERLSFLAYHDVLTELPNRRLLEERLEEENSRCQRHAQYSAILFIDLDDFKQINDQYGHIAGDKLLIKIAQRLVSSSRREDFICRLAGDEFVVVLSFIADNKSQAKLNAVATAENLLKGLQEPIDISTQLVQCNASIGVSLIPNGILKSKIIINEADRAMYRAKANGKSGVSLGDEFLHW